MHLSSLHSQHAGPSTLRFQRSALSSSPASRATISDVSTSAAVDDDFEKVAGQAGLVIDEGLVGADADSQLTPMLGAQKDRRLQSLPILLAVSSLREDPLHPSSSVSHLRTPGNRLILTGPGRRAPGRHLCRASAAGHSAHQRRLVPSVHPARHKEDEGSGRGLLFWQEDSTAKGNR